MKNDHFILCVHVTDRLKEAVEVQKLLTTYGDQIKTRLGLHEIATGEEGLNGLLILEMVPPAERVRELADKLNAIEGVETQEVNFGH